MFKNYIFDLYGTLIDIHTDEDSAALWEKMSFFYGYRGAHYSPSELLLKYKEYCSIEKTKLKALKPEYEYIDIDLSRVFRRLYCEKGIEPDDRLVELTCNVFRCISTDYIRLYDGVTDLLTTLRKKGKNVYLLSNAQHDFTVPEITMLGLKDYFDDIVISADEQCRKPDAHMYDILFKRHNLVKNETIMIGNDFLSDIKSAYDYGIRSLYIHQKISPPITGKLYSDFTIMNGNVKEIKKHIIR